MRNAAVATVVESVQSAAAAACVQAVLSTVAAADVTQADSYHVMCFPELHACALHSIYTSLLKKMLASLRETFGVRRETFLDPSKMESSPRNVPMSHACIQNVLLVRVRIYEAKT